MRDRNGGGRGGRGEGLECDKEINYLDGDGGGGGGMGDKSKCCHSKEKETK